MCILVICRLLCVFLSGVFTCIDFSSAGGEILEHSQGSSRAT